MKVGSGINTFSIAVSSSTNILGGSNIGGNAYDNASGDTSFSRSCTDTDQNDICDSSLAHNANNADHAPLAIGTRSASTSAHSGTSHNPSPSGGIYICSPKWVCSEWTCTNGTARRTCSDENNCQTGKPAEEKTCPLPQKATQYALFDIQSELLTYNKSSAVMRVSLINFGDPGSVNVQLVYTLLHHNGDILLQEFETVEVETQHEFLKTLNLPQLAPGEYSILTELLYDGQKEPARTLLPFIITTKHSSFPLIVLTIPAIFTALSAAYVLHSRAPSTSYIVCRRAIEEVEHAAQIHDHKKAVTHFLHLRYYFHQLSEKEQKKLGEDALRTYHLVHNLFQ